MLSSSILLHQSPEDDAMNVSVTVSVVFSETDIDTVLVNSATRKRPPSKDSMLIKQPPPPPKVEVLGMPHSLITQYPYH